MMNPVPAFLYWMGGTDRVLIAQSSNWVRMAYQALGLVFAINWLILSLAWSKVFIPYFGLFGIIPGLLLPTLFVIGLDRIIASRPRTLRGNMERYHVDTGNDGLFARIVRIFIAMALCCCTTFSFQLALSRDLINETQQRETQLANEPLRQEYIDALDAEFTAEADRLNDGLAQLEEERIRQKDTLDNATRLYNEAAAAARDARNEVFYEDGGLDGRPSGQGERYEAQLARAEYNETQEQEARQVMEQAAYNLDSINARINEHQTALSQLQREYNLRFEEINEQVAQDPRYLTVKSDVFSDVTTFINLFQDSDRSLGMYLYSFMTLALLMSLELGALISLSQMPASEYDALKNVAIVRNTSISAAPKEMAEIMADISTYQAFTSAATADFDTEVAQLMEKVLRAKLDKINAELRAQQASQADSLDIKLSTQPVTSSMMGQADDRQVEAQAKAEAKPATDTASGTHHETA